ALAGAASATGCRVLLPRADAADPGLPAALRANGATAEEVVAYHTVEGPPASRAPLAAALARSDLAVVVAASGSAVRGLLRLVDDPLVRDRLDRLALVTIGPSTSGVAREAGLAVAEEAAEPTPVALAEAVVRAVAATAATSLAGTPATPTPASPAPAPTAPAFPEAPA
ncbi:MAG TPA: uroporphyrinogen-III synthase, partial [Candidatus Limnocylindrales bacterium]